jgi:hypothetical protein
MVALALSREFYFLSVIGIQIYENSLSALEEVVVFRVMYGGDRLRCSTGSRVSVIICVGMTIAIGLYLIEYSRRVLINRERIRISKQENPGDNSFLYTWRMGAKFDKSTGKEQ